MDQSIEKHKLKGNFYIWQYKERNPQRLCWNFTADIDACDSLLRLIGLMEQSGFSSTKSIKTSIPANLQIDVPNNRNKNWLTKSFIELRYLKPETDQWSIIPRNDSLEIIAGKNKMAEFKTAITRVKAGEGDFAISDKEENHILYFWWSLKK